MGLGCLSMRLISKSHDLVRTPGGLFIFRELGSTGKYFRGAGEQAHNFGHLGSTATKLRKRDLGRSEHYF